MILMQVKFLLGSHLAASFGIEKIIETSSILY